MKNFGKFFVTLLVFLIMTVGFAQSQTKTEWWGSAIQISLPNSTGDLFSINWEEGCFRRTMSFSGSSDTTRKTIAIRCLSYGADSVRIVLGNYNLPMTVSFGGGNPIYWPEIFKMPHIITSGIKGDSIIIALEFKGGRNIVFFINELAYKYNGGSWVVHHDFSVPTFSGRPTSAQELQPITGEFLKTYQSVKFAYDGETTVVSYRFKKSAVIAANDTLYFASFLGEKSSGGVVYPDDLGSNDLTCRVVWNNPAYMAGYLFNTTVYVAKKKTSQTGVETTVNDEDMKSELISGYPNPFNPSTNIKYSLVNGGHVTLAIYNIRGQEVARLIDNNETAGSHSIVWNGTDNYGNQMSSGVYICLLRAGGYTKKFQMTLLK